MFTRVVSVLINSANAGADISLFLLKVQVFEEENQA